MSQLIFGTMDQLIKTREKKKKKLKHLALSDNATA
jgi:hypothetical protein